VRNSLTPANAKADHSQQKGQSKKKKKTATLVSKQLKLTMRKGDAECRTHRGKNKDICLSVWFTEFCTDLKEEKFCREGKCNYERR